MRILIVEGSDSIMHMIEALVAARGFEVACANGGARAIEDALANTPDVVLLDLDLQGGVGAIEVCRKLRAQAETELIPIIALGASGDEAVRQSALEAGATTYYRKPFSPISLLKEIEAIKAKLRSSGTEKVP
jgi:DNA-binding response OmpR family regulator